MPTQVLSKWRAALNIRLLTDASRGTLLASILKVAPQSTLMSNAAVAAAYAALTTRGATRATNVAGAAAARQQLTISVNLLGTSRGAFDLALLALAGLVSANATSADDLTGMGFTLFSLTKPSRTPPDPPVGALIVTMGRAHGKARVTVPRAGNGTRFAAEVSNDPIGIWSSLPGTGRQRKLSGATGTRLWVRFATVRFGMQSDWSTPVLVTLP
jgi:hypothetical protein